MGAMVNVGGIVATVARGAMICAVALLCVAAYGAGSLRRLALRDRAVRRAHRDRQRGRLLRWSFSTLGTSFIKAGQVMSSRADLLPPAVIAALRELQDHVRPFAFARVCAILERELGVLPTRVFRVIDPVPLAAGSIAQVHRGVLRSGEEVAIKVLRPGVRARVRRDARLLLWLAHLAHAASARARAADVIGHARSLVAGIIVQTDLRRESENYDRFRAYFDHTTGLAFPRVHHAYATRAVLTMELIHGVHLERVRPEHVPQVTQVLRDAFFAMCFQHGLVHADLHPGNILVRDDGTVVVLDVGLVKHLDADAIARLVDLARCLVVGTPADLVAHLRAHHHGSRTTRWDAVATDVSTFIASLRRSTIAELEVSAVVATLFALARKHRIRPLPEMSLVLLGMVTIEGIAKRLDPDANTLAEIARYFAARLVPTPVERRPALARGSQADIPLIPLPVPTPAPAPAAVAPAPADADAANAPMLPPA